MKPRKMLAGPCSLRVKSNPSLACRMSFAPSPLATLSSWTKARSRDSLSLLGVYTYTSPRVRNEAAPGQRLSKLLTEFVIGLVRFAKETIFARAARPSGDGVILSREITTMLIFCPKCQKTVNASLVHGSSINPPNLTNDSEELSAALDKGIPLDVMHTPESGPDHRWTQRGRGKAQSA